MHDERQLLCDITWPYLTLPYGEGVLPPSAEASLGAFSKLQE